jgi:acyl carrier protein
MNTATTPDSIRSTVLAIVARHARLDVASLAGEATLKDLGIGSLTAIEVLFDIEDHFDFEFTEQGANFDAGTLNDLVAAVESRVAAGAEKAAASGK